MEAPAVAASAGVSASRQKNCNACVQAKRRCDRRMPICSRCTEKKVDCLYSKSRTANRPGKHTRAPTPCTEALSLLEGPTLSALDIPVPSFDISRLDAIPSDFYPDVIIESISQPIQDTPSGSDMSMDTFMHFMGGSVPSSSDQWLVTAEEAHAPRRPTTPVDADVIEGYEKMATCQFDTWQVYDPKTPLYYIVHRVKGFTSEMATKNTTPFIHHSLYRGYTPQCIVSCFTACVLYANRTSANTAMAMRALSNSARELVNAETGSVIPTPIEKLARSHALLFYQTIRLFDGDIALRAQGEKDMELLKTWLEELCQIRDNLGGLARLESASVREQPPMEWEKWVFAECLRRTVLMAYAVIGLYELLKDPDNMDPENPWAYVHRWTLGRSLWEANSPIEFQRAWRDSRYFIIANFTLEGFIENGKGDDVDEFGEMLLVAYMGTDAMKGIMQRRETT
ncbi:putative C6 zinc finger domain-containing protein [Rosellinia necatrix]|uniref:Putative C6 zinc finger domain-containing protein n=1 Tax=Rosellinia necatrix TaxID=77044 RepID=A0A1W2TG67_ROSNE|nr:putative C6 zinc finger domain-containing protein [Rosellinia necatrix]